MCDPVTITAVALGAAQAGMSIHGQRQQAKTQEKVQKNASKAEQQRYLQEMTAMRMQMNAMDDMMRDENGMSTEDSFGFHAAVQAMFDAAAAFDDWMMQEKKFGNK